MISVHNPLKLHKSYDHSSSDRPRLAVVCIHGIATDSSSFEKALAYFKGMESLNDVRFIAFDLLGAGKSPASVDLAYDYKEQLEALNNSIADLKLDIPLVLIGHSMGTLIATRYAYTHENAVKKLILISPPVYTERDLNDPAFLEAMRVFRDAVSLKSREKASSNQFDASMKNIVSDKKNYQILAELTTPATLIYGFKDQIIAPYNIPKVLRENPKFLTAIKTEGLHGVTVDKYSKIPKILREVLDEIS